MIQISNNENLAIFEERCRIEKSRMHMAVVIKMRAIKIKMTKMIFM
jgi:hypothetical protein